MSETTAEAAQDQATTEATIKPEDIPMPAPSFWPIVLAFGFTLILAGLAINLALAIVGVVIVLVSVVGWAIEPLFPEGGH